MKNLYIFLKIKWVTISKEIIGNFFIAIKSITSDKKSNIK